MDTRGGGRVSKVNTVRATFGCAMLEINFLQLPACVINYNYISHQQLLFERGFQQNCATLIGSTTAGYMASDAWMKVTPIDDAVHSQTTINEKNTTYQKEEVGQNWVNSISKCFQI